MWDHYPEDPALDHPDASFFGSVTSVSEDSFELDLSKCTVCTTEEQKALSKIDKVVESTQLFYCDSCGKLSYSDTGFCQGTNHQLRQSKCRMQPIELVDKSRYMKGSIRYRDFKTGEEARGLDQSVSLARDKLRRVLRLRRERELLLEQARSLKESLDYLKKQLEDDEFGLFI